MATTNALTNQPYTQVLLAERATTGENFVIRNIEGSSTRRRRIRHDRTIDPQRNYRALMLLLSRRSGTAGAYKASYVLAKAEGNVDNSGFGNWLGGNVGLPEHGQTNSVGELTNSRRHEVKVYLTPGAEDRGLFGGDYTG